MTDDTYVHALTIPIEFGGRTVSITPTAVETDDGLLLVDAGPEPATDRLATALADVGFGLADVERVILTHHDADHAGGLAPLREHTDVTIGAHPAEIPHVTGDEMPVKGPDDDRYPPVAVDEELTDGEEFSTRAGPLRVVETPGHTAGHISLYLPDERLLLAGDALVADEDEPLSGPKPAYTVDEDRAADSVASLAELDVEHVICHHGGYAPCGSDRIHAIAASLQDGD
ncbi:Zn-dependent hydrolase, glyoxylase [Halovivax ruber XH-70]|uniref:Zn-dependent hydrolase, glyoxylase n=1 Tax=Halovivax ruber (strain DSM 18193 / JCM 13892 / XH-70) TaxID=797302 RepID=L0I8S6_HALRX|nr:MBL fold metallo-hydrolase [Halovivax ruber]AGB16000.1 Zn-dependent hydrolase, glyoxylase [Halovivax ruber XH-70]